MKIIITDDNQTERVFHALTSMDKPLAVTIKPHKSNRSLEQNSLYWKWIDAIRLHILDSQGEAYSGQEVHEHFKAKFLPSRVVEIGGEKIRCRGTTTKLNTKEMAEYMEKLDQYCADRLHLVLPVKEVT